MRFLVLCEKCTIFAAETNNYKLIPMKKIHVNNQMQLIACVYEKYRSELLLYFAHHTKNMMLAEDLTQDLFVKIMSVDVVCVKTIRSLLFLAARRMIIDEARHKAYIYKGEENLKCELELVDASAYDKIFKRDLLEWEERRIIAMPRKRAAVYRLWREDRSMKEIAKILGMAPRTVESHVYHAVCDMKKYFGVAM